MYDYEIEGYSVKWKTGEEIHRRDGFSTEESATDFAREKLKTTDNVTIIQARRMIGW